MAQLTGAVINVYSEKTLAIEPGARGTAAIALPLDWYKDGEMISFYADNDVWRSFAHSFDELPLLREMMKRAYHAYVWPLLSGGAAAQNTLCEGVLARAVKAGSRGNAIGVECAAFGGLWRIRTTLGTETADIQTVASAAEFKENGFIELSGEGELSAATITLSGGSDGEESADAWDDFIAALEFLDPNAVAYTGSDAAVKAKLLQFAKRRRDEEDRFLQVCAGNYPADSECVISFANGVTLADGTAISAEQASAWLAGATAAAAMNESLTYSCYDGAVGVNGELKRSEQLEKKAQGLGCFIMNNGRAKVESDINTLVTYSARKQKDFSKNRVLRVIDGVCSDIKAVFDSSFAGAEHNNTDGRNRFKASICDYLTALGRQNAIEGFTSDDVSVTAGADKDSVIVSLAICPVDSMEKANITVRVR